MHKILFLDIDGVLNILSESYRTLMRENKETQIEKHLVERLEYIIQETQALIVVSSSWRYNMTRLKRELNKCEFKFLHHIVDHTPYLQSHRGAQIKQWLTKHSDIVDAYCVLDDEIIDICGEYCDVIPHSNVVHVDSKEGLSQTDVNRVIIILNS